MGQCASRPETKVRRPTNDGGPFEQEWVSAPQEPKGASPAPFVEAKDVKPEAPAQKERTAEKEPDTGRGQAHKVGAPHKALALKERDDVGRCSSAPRVSKLLCLDYERIQAACVICWEPQVPKK